MFLSKGAIRAYSSGGGVRVAILGAAGQVGQPLAMMLKNSPVIDELALYDMPCSTAGLCMELSHIDTKCTVCSYKGRIQEALEGTNVVVIVASATRMSNCDLTTMFKPNAPIMFDLIASCAKFCPKAMIAIATNPVNSMVPIASEVMKKFGVYNPKTIFGVTTLDVMRTNMFAAKVAGIPPEKVQIPVIGGHSDKTIVPLLSQSCPHLDITNEELIQITDDVQTARDCLIMKKKLTTLSLAPSFAISRFVISLARAAKGEENIVECAYVRSDLYSDIKYLATPVLLSSTGILKHLPIPQLSDYEDCLLQNAAIILREDIKLGEAFATGKGYKPEKTNQSSDKAACISELDVCNPCA